MSEVDVNTAPIEAQETAEGTPDPNLRKPETVKKFNMKDFWDKVTTGLFIFLLSSPVLILIYILTWFINK